MRFLVTATGGDVGQAVLSVLRAAISNCTIIGTDVKNGHAGVAICDHFEQVSPASSSCYLSSIHNLSKIHNVDFIIPVSEPELERISNDPSGYFCGRIIAPSRETINTCLDKYATVQFLKKHGINAPETFLASDTIPRSGPYVHKARKGCGSKSVKLLNDIARESFDKGDDFILQEVVGSIDSEFTCGLFRSAEGIIRTISLRRRMEGGLTSHAVVEKHHAIDEMLRKVAEGLNLVGSINVQLRLTLSGPRIFEINPRFSSTTYFRHLLGFKDLLWAIEDVTGRELSAYAAPENGVEVYRVSTALLRKPKG